MNNTSGNNIAFLEGGGEMGKLIRQKDWDKTSLGAAQFWPQSLRTALDILLNSQFPMFLFWGKGLVFFYNDAFRSGLGREGKRPSVPGMEGKDAWPEMWPTIKPLIDRVLINAEAVRSEDQLIPTNRNGAIEDACWTFSYSPVKDETGKPTGVFVTCTETTDKVLAYKKVEENKSAFEFALEATELGTWNYDPISGRFSSNERLKSWFGLSPNQEVELSYAINAMLKSDRERVSEAIRKALEFSSGGNYDIEYTIVHPITKKEILVHAKGKTWFNEQKIAYRFNGTLEDITEKAMATKKIRESEERYHHLIYSSPSAIGILYGEDLVITIANDAIIKIWGKGKEIMGKSYFEALPELAEQGYQEVFAEVYNTGIPFNAVETPVQIMQEGKSTLKYYNFLLYPQRDINNEIDGIGIIATEVTSQALLNSRIKESEQRFQAAVQAVKGIVWTNNAKGEMEGEQKGWAELTGQKYDEYQGYGWTKAIHPDDVESNIKAWKEAVAEIKTFNFEHRVKTADGNWRAFSIRALPLKNDDGSLREWVGVHMDIQKQKTFAAELEKQVRERTKELTRSHELLKKSEERYHLMVEEVQDYAILYLNRKGIVENWNTGAEKIKGYKASEIIGKSFSNFYTQSDREDNLPQKLLQRAADTGRAVQEGWRVRKDGTLFWASVVITAVHNDKNDVIGFSKVTHDLTEKKNVEDQLKNNASLLEQKNNDLEKMNKELQSFAYISSHDLQEPLRKIQTLISHFIDKETPNVTENGKHTLKRIQVSALRMQTLINDLLAYSRTGNAGKSYEVTDLNKMVENVKADLKEELQQKNAKIEWAHLCEVNIIPFQFSQLLHNLISNSLKFASADRPLQIRIESHTGKGAEFNNESLSGAKNYCHIRISDNGIGFDPRYSLKIFELFQRLHSNDEFTGTGIGLAIVKKIVDNHNGIITAHGELDKGASFDIYIPVG